MTSVEEGTSQMSVNAKPLSNIKNIENSLQILKGKITQMNKKEFNNTKEIQKVFYSSIPLIKNKLQRSFEYQKFAEKRKNNLDQSVLRNKMDINRQRKLINQKEIQRNRELLNIMKFNQRNSVKQLSKKNQLFIQKMKSQRLQENRKKRELVKQTLQNSRFKIQEFHLTKQQQLRKKRAEEHELMQKKMIKMVKQLGMLNEKENKVVQRSQKSGQMLNRLRNAVTQIQKMSEQQFLKIRQKVLQNDDQTYKQEKIIQKIIQYIMSNDEYRNVSTHCSKVSR